MNMKKIILSSIILAFALSACAPLRIVLNNDRNGVRKICTSDVDLFSSFEIAMGLQIQKADTLMALLITCNKDSDHGLFDKNDRLLIRFADGEEMALRNIYNQEYDKEVNTNYTTDTYYNDRLVYAYSPYTDEIYVTPVTFRTFVPRVYTSTRTRSYALYPITKQQYIKVTTKEIEKLRIEIENEDCDMPYPDRFSERVKELHDFIVTKTKEKSLDF